MHIKSIKKNEQNQEKNFINTDKKNKNETFENKKAIEQIRNITQEKDFKNLDTKENDKQDLPIKNIEDLIKMCHLKKEAKLKYELENNVNLVSFENGRIEISFNDRLEKDFIKNLTSKLLEWTNLRWIISLSKKAGEKTFKEIKLDKEKNLINEAKSSETYKKIVDTFIDAELIEVEKKYE
tara:strand:- start:464 stop:1006 length:543 start_codon:yes stop_codon:yes gene_type:complete